MEGGGGYTACSEESVALNLAKIFPSSFLIKSEP